MRIPILNFFYLAWLKATIVKGQSQPRLQILPLADKHTVFLDSGYALSCEIVGLGPQVVDVVLRWFDPHGMELTEIQNQQRTLYVMKEEGRPLKTLFFKKIRFEDEGTYSCEGVVEGNLESKSVTLVVNKKITFDHCPSPQTAILHHDAFIECRVSGKPTPIVVWEHKNMKLINDYRYSQDVGGLYIKNISKHDEGIYQCHTRVSELGEFGVRNIEVIVQVPPSINRNYLIFEGIQGQDLTLPCMTTGDPKPRVEFYKDNNLDPLYTNNRRQYDPEGGELTFRPLAREDAGNYLCKAFNNAGEDHEDIRLNVIERPSIYSLYNQTGVENKSVELVCISRGDPAPQMSFRKAGAASDFRTGDNDNGRIVITQSDDYTLVLRINRLIPDDMANYTCMSTNRAGYDHRNGTITVQFVPRFTVNNVASIYIWPGKTRNITCFTMSEPLPSFEWVKYPRIPFAIRNNETYRIHVMGRDSNLQVTVREQDQNWIYGNYTCRATNQIGRNELIIDLIRAHLPGPPKSIEAKVITSDLVVLKVAPPENDGGVEIINYRVDFEARSYVFDSEEILLEQLRPSTTYMFNVRVGSEVGFGEPYSMAVKTEDVKRPSKLVITSRPQGPQINRYTITWAKPITGGLSIKEYEIKFRRVEGEGENLEPVDDWRVRHRHDDDLRPMTSYTLESLRGGTQYQLELRARNDLGYSEFNDLFVFRTFDVNEPESDHYTNSKSCPLASGLLLVCSIVISRLM